jgi:pimeloyl-ACP methyl ester carboxylesterase
VIGDRRATVVAHSAAGHIAVLAAMAAPERIASLALWEPSAPWMEFWPERARESVARISSAPDPGAIAERGIKAMVGTEAWNRLSQEKQAERRAEGDAFVLDMSFGMEAPYDWADLHVPCLIGHGAQWPHDVASPLLARAISCPTFTIEGAPHAAHLSHPEQFAEFARQGLALA